MTTTDTATKITRWLLTGARAKANLAAVLDGLVARLTAAGLRIDRATIGAPLMHPIARSSFSIWTPLAPARENEVIWDEVGMDRLRNSPMYPIYGRGEDVDWRLGTEGEPGEYGIGAELRADGFTHYLGLALPFADGSFKGLTLQTKRGGGFSESERALLRELVPPLAAVVEHHVQKRLAQTLMDTFVGQRAGRRVLEGQIHRGDGDTIRAVIWMSDIRAFTQLAAERAPQEVIGLLNRSFEAVTNAILDNGGEVLKFIGDAVLGIFPVETDAEGAVARAEAAVAELRASRAAPDWPGEVEIGVALHLGEVFYGNIGGRERLDFTVIGAAVNLVARVEGLCGVLGEPVLVTAEVARLSGHPYTGRGAYDVKGVAVPVEVFAPER
ncbi:adenylate/guanylate cyclase domain-containing protein [Ruegeria marina]|uniref:Adenylate cyclase n=1 Tax=Ruegeria marina TaxID=639004 RepID=A0A1G6N2T9_9RHOB|nr:adenylate/guanylate cyclase domain-containing protein [Ruegeria marina]SDC62168.1 adenylate cyclase [Ruegeria marina]